MSMKDSNLAEWPILISVPEKVSGASHELIVLGRSLRGMNPVVVSVVAGVISVSVSIVDSVSASADGRLFSIVYEFITRKGEYQLYIYCLAQLSQMTITFLAANFKKFLEVSLEHGFY